MQPNNGASRGAWGCSVKIIIGVIVGFVVLAIGGLAIAGFVFRDLMTFLASAPRATEVRVETVAARELIESVPAPGEIEPNTKVDISATVVAEIVALPFREGDLVKKGDVVVRLDDRELTARLLGAQASLESTKANLESVRASRARTQAQLLEQQARHKGVLTTLEFAEKNLQRKRELHDSGDIPLAELETAQERVREVLAQIDASNMLIAAAESSLQAADAQILQAEAAVRQGEAEIRLAEEALRNTIIASPIDGKVTKLNAEVGERVVTGTMNNPGTVIMTIADLSRMKMIARVAEADVAKLQTGQKARVTIETYRDTVFHGVVDRIALQRTTANDGTGFFETEIMLRLDGREIRSGHVANVEIEIATHTGIVVPSQAVVERAVEDLPIEVVENNPHVDRNKKTIRVAYRVVDGKAVATPVRVGPSDLTHTLVLGGLDAGDVIVTGPYKVLDKIRHDERVVDLTTLPRKPASGAAAGGSTGGSAS